MASQSDQLVFRSPDLNFGSPSRHIALSIYETSNTPGKFHADLAATKTFISKKQKWLDNIRLLQIIGREEVASHLGRTRFDPFESYGHRVYDCAEGWPGSLREFDCAREFHEPISG